MEDLFVLPDDREEVYMKIIFSASTTRKEIQMHHLLHRRLFQKGVKCLQETDSSSSSHSYPNNINDASSEGMEEWGFVNNTYSAGTEEGGGANDTYAAGTEEGGY